ncbi:uncharacterized protein LOC134701155 [Mytilus trossulus]|uniref:uncharacterized protein LOC134701155 n=1 Tax=Mytilus trossulus TaxID=6551 RepID=UPI0030054037
MRVLFNQKCYFEIFHFKLFLIMMVCVKLSTAPSLDNQFQRNDNMDGEEIQITQKRKRIQSEQDKTRPELKKQKKGKKGNTKNMTTRRTIYSSYVYGYICQKKQILYSIIQELIEIIFYFELICYIHELSYLQGVSSFFVPA